MSIQLERSVSQWSETIPDDWDFTRANRVATEHRETVSPAKLDLKRIFHYSIPVIDETGDGHYENPANIKSSKLILEGGEVLISKLNPRKSRVLLASNHQPLSVASGEFIPLRPNTDLVLPRYLETVFLSEPARQYLDGIATSATKSHQRVSPREIREFRFPRPPVEEQRRLVSFLDHRTARIDALVAKQKRILDLLDEKRQAFITRAVTAGLDLTVATKNTGVEWLGEIPEQWEPIRLKFLLTGIEQGWSPQCKDRPAGPDQWGVLKAGAANKGRFHEDENKILPSDREPKSEYEIQQGDLLMNRASGSPEYLGSVALVPEVRSKLLLCDKLFRLHIREEIASPEFLSISLRSHPLRHQIIAAISGAEGLANNLPQAGVKELILAVPPLAEQKQITQNVLDWEAQVESLIQEIERAIDLLEEKRQALITAAVTGQIDGIEGRGEIQDQPL